MFKPPVAQFVPSAPAASSAVNSPTGSSRGGGAEFGNAAAPVSRIPRYGGGSGSRGPSASSTPRALDPSSGSGGGFGGGQQQQQSSRPSSGALGQFPGKLGAAELSSSIGSGGGGVINNRPLSRQEQEANAATDGRYTDDPVFREILSFWKYYKKEGYSDEAMQEWVTKVRKKKTFYKNAAPYRFQKIITFQ